ncbi:hypothetical protein HNR06_002582 [Nocardiopsis arvandica]|uniref:Uncharacterized protein n=1 Tax=Nocardiopsis sinuspersici TaxID=501010 RepID=A0A7Y9XEA3_9ACTN|nr:hypothetical protein [Nocardiopsis sinuspersici]NYH52993.1 hypothetical protein [Nocardiopsis sinuspersici]
MSGPHGFLGAPGADAVASASARRALTLVGLLIGTIGAVWFLGTSFAQADELPQAEGTVEQAEALGAAEDAPPVGETAEQATEALPGAEPEAPEESEAGATEPAEPVVATESAEPVGTAVSEEEPIRPAASTGPVESVGPVGHATGHLEAGVQGGHRLTEVGHDTSEALARHTAEGDAEVVGHLNRAVNGTATGLGGRVGSLLGTTGPSGHGEPVYASAEGREAPGNHGAESTRTEPVDSTDAQEGVRAVAELPFPASDEAVSGGATTDGALSAEAPTTDPAVTITMDSAATSGASAPVVAGFLTTAGSLLPEPGPTQAARHVSHALPSAADDEPTFAPD